MAPSKLQLSPLIVSRIGYALPVWSGFVCAELNCKIDAMFKRLKRYVWLYKGQPYIVRPVK